MTRFSGGRLASAGVFVLSGAVAAACTLLNALDAYGPPTGAGPGAGDGGGFTSPDADTCAHARWADPPTKDDGAGNIDVVFAVNALYLKAPPNFGPTTGFDLDNVCTCPGPATCKGASDGRPCDLDGGIDNAGSELLSTLLAQAAQGTDATEKLQAGQRGVLLRLGEYNGGANDSQVIFSVLLSPGTERDRAGAPIPPKHDGNDRWLVDKGSAVAENGPPFLPKAFDQKAYVSDGIVVAKFDFPLYFGELVVELTDTVITAKITKTPGGLFQLEEGRFVGRWSTGKLLTSLDTLGDPFGGSGGVCGTNAAYLAIKPQICKAADLMKNPSADSTGAACNALGITTFFTAETAQLGAGADRVKPTRFCGDGWTDDCP